MHRSTKMATCCYCGTHSTLVLGADRHTLACGACGAPISNLKSLPTDTRGEKSISKGIPVGKTKKENKKKKKKKSPVQRLFSEIVDEIEDFWD